ncbi:hypothetical protein B0H17DRAFT_1334771 [Mycena rosella]|uniref:Aminoglycoside phosphotransferase domain-containing protein n=1 Tax=Mycena rosella TaxID=1033263 RepID=A0AAD7D3B0_MYCRO|nr:hypothetical protein B0H17DRAFT_1334771 [Mycena rosella]
MLAGLVLPYPSSLNTSIISYLFLSDDTGIWCSAPRALSYDTGGNFDSLPPATTNEFGKPIYLIKTRTIAAPSRACFRSCQHQPLAVPQARTCTLTSESEAGTTPTETKRPRPRSNDAEDDDAPRSRPVATLRYVQKNTTIPVPEVYHAVSTTDNPVGARYMLMQRIPGQLLLSQWTHSSAEGRRKVITQLADFQAQLLTLKLPKIGCLVDENGTVGPLDFLLAHVNAELDLLANRAVDWIKQRTTWAACNGGFDDLPAKYATQWFQLLLNGIMALPADLLGPPESPLVLFHDDFNESNILVSHSDPTQVVGIIDW